MRRRQLLMLGAAAAAVAPIAGFASSQGYAPGLVRAELAAGQTVFVDFKARWCTTCARQERVINALKAENPAYDQVISFVTVDWDVYGNSELAQSLNIPRRSTLVVLKGDQELGRSVAGTSRKVIKGLMDTALSAAMG